MSVVLALSTGAWTGSVVAAYLGVGLSYAGYLTYRGEGQGLALAAVVAWPLLGTFDDSAPAPPGGPYAQRIHAALDALQGAFDDPALGDEPFDADLSGLRASMLAADARVRFVDDALAEATSSQDPAVARSSHSLASARTEVASDIEAVLAEVVQLRLHVGLLALQGHGGRLRERVGELSARAASLGEIEGLEFR